MLNKLPLQYFRYLFGFVAAALLLTSPQAVTAPPVPSMIMDIHPGNLPSFPDELTVAGSNLFYVATDDTHGRELWATNPITSTLVEDIAPGDDSFTPHALASYQGKLYFSGNAGAAGNGEELWVSDGTAGGTFELKDLNLAGDGNPTLFKVSGAYLYFQGCDSTHGCELWRTDGTSGGTVMVKDIRLGGVGSSPTIMTDVDGVVFFVANDGLNGEELWVSDGTEANTQMVKDINEAASGSEVRRLINVGGTLYFRAGDGIHGRELWKSDGTPGGTGMVKDINPTGDSVPDAFVSYNGLLYFSASDGVHGIELWKSDGSEGGTVMVANIVPDTPPVSGSGIPTELEVVGDTLYFSATTPQSGRELWKSDGTTSGTALVKDIRPGPTGSSPVGFKEALGTLFFQANDGVTGAEFWKSNGTAASTLLVEDINPGPNPSTPALFKVLGDKLFFSANDGEHGVELWGMTLSNTAPTADAGGPYSGNEGSPIALSGSVIDDDLSSIAAWSANNPACTFSDPAALITTVTCPDNGDITLTLDVWDWWGAQGSDTATVHLDNLDPQITSLTFNPPVVPFIFPVQATLQFTDAGAADTHTATIDWGEGIPESMTVNETTDTATASHIYSQDGLFSVHVTLLDDDAGMDEEFGSILALKGIFLPLVRAH